MRYVQGYGNPNAKLVVVGEAPGYHEEQEGIPFVGPSGKIVDECLYKGGMDPSEIYKTNVCKVRPPDNEIHRLKELGVSIEEFIPKLWQEIESIKPNCILAFGNVALKALTGQTGIQKYRGSILSNCHSGLPKVVGSIHPASLFHETDGKMKSYRDKAFIQFDVNRAIQQSQFRELKLPDRTLIRCRSSLDLIRFRERNAKRVVMASDIETFKTIPMCISFAFSKYEAISVPLFDLMSDQNPEGIALHDMVILWKLVTDMLLDPQYKLIGQNWKFDEGRNEEIGLVNAPLWADVGMAWHCLYSELPKALEFISSILTEEPYYKDELEEYSPNKDKLDKRLRYNAKDSAVTIECWEKIEPQLEEAGVKDFFFEKVMPLHGFYSRLEKRGFKIDLTERKRLTRKYERYTNWINFSLRRDLGYDLNVMSPKQVAASLYGDLKCPVRKGTDEETLTMLMLNAVKDERRKRIIGNILKGRKSRKTQGTYVKAKLWPDGRCRTTYNINGTESGRTSTSKPKQPITVEPMGVAFQTMTKHGDVGADLRSMYVPDSGYCFLEIDGKQAEDWVVAHLANDEEGKALLGKKEFKRNKFGLKDDRHTLTTMMVLGMDFDAITADDRQIGKKVRHAGNYKMGKRRLSLLAEISEWRAGKCLERFHAENPKIAGVFWEEIEQALYANDQVLFSAHGRRRQFFDRWGEDMLKEALSFIPQAVVSDHTKFCAVRVEQLYPWLSFIIMESHDSFLLQCPIDRVDEALPILIKEYETPIDFSKCSLPRDPLVIPAEIHVGYKNWKEMKQVA
jgi:uracil-DNA glycosylase family 4